MSSLKNFIGGIFLFSVLLLVNNASGQRCPDANHATGESDFLADLLCPWCYPTSPTQNGTANSVPCYLTSVSSSEVTGVNFHYVLIFDEKFSGDALDLSKWVTAKQTEQHGGEKGVQDYDDGANFQFSHPGIDLIDENVPSFQARAIDWQADTTHESDGNPNLRYWTYKGNSLGLQTQYQFPMFNNTTYNISYLTGAGPDDIAYLYPYSYGIYQLTATLPQVQSYAGGPSPQPPYGGSVHDIPFINGYIWPAFWMWGYDESLGYYGEIDGFEFSKDASDDIQTSHYPTVIPDDCASVYDAYFGDGTQHNFYSIYTPDEIDWWVDGTNTRLDTKYYGEDDPVVGDNTFYPICQPSVTSDADDYNYENCVFPQNVPMWLTVANGAQVGAQSQYFPVHFPVQSVKYWVPGNCDNSTTVTKTDIHNSNTLQFNAFTGTTVTIDGITNGAIDSFDIPSYRKVAPSYHNKPPGGFTHGNLEAIAINKVQIIGNFQGAGYLVLKADGNMCDEYSGPYPYDDSKSSRRPTKRGASGDTLIIHKTNNKKHDSLSLQILNTVTRGEFQLNLTNISEDQLNQSADIMVYNMLGQLLYQGKMQVAPEKLFDINLSVYASGVYLVMVKTNNKLLQRKIILEK